MVSDGGEETQSSVGTKTCACTLAGKHISVKLDIKESVVPLLSSKSSTKLPKIKLIFLNDTVEIFGNTVELNDKSAGDYCLPFRKQW